MKRNTGIAAGVFGAGMLVAGLLVSVVGPAQANHLPADKPFAAASKVERFSEGARVPLLSATVRNAKPTDMILQVSMECSIITDNVISGTTVAGATQRAETNGTVRAWIEIDGQTVPIISQSSPPQQPGSTPPNDEGSKVTFCNRVFDRTVSDRESSGDGIDYSQDYIATKAANSFNWVRLNMGSGVHQIVLYGDLTHFATPGSTASAFVGNRSMIGQPGKFANDATINEGGTG